MLRLNLKKDPYWLELPAGVKLKVRPLSTALMSMAQSSVIKQISSWRQEHASRMDVGADVSEIPDVDDEHTRLGLSESLLIKALAHGALIEWESVMDESGTIPAPLSPKTINDLMDIWFIAQEFWKQYTNSLLILEMEGNDLGLAAHGTSAAGPDIAKDAMTKTSPAVKAKKVQ
jgi:hypothetical protein